MTHITLSIPDDLYKVMKKYKEINWSEIARRAIIEKLLLLKAQDEGITRKELMMLLEITRRRISIRSYKYDKEIEFLEKIKKREKKRINLLKRLERS
mgnify:CR=1 FL=1